MSSDVDFDESFFGKLFIFYKIGKSNQYIITTEKNYLIMEHVLGGKYVKIVILNQ